MRTTFMTQSTPTSTRTQTKTRVSCTSEHGTLSALFRRHTLMMCHTSLAQVVRESHVIRMPWWAFLLDLHLPRFLLQPVPHRLLPLLCPDAPWRAHRPSTTWTPWKITCATPPRGALTLTTSSSPSQIRELSRKTHDCIGAKLLIASAALRAYRNIILGHSFDVVRHGSLLNTAPNRSLLNVPTSRGWVRLLRILLVKILLKVKPK